MIYLVVDDTDGSVLAEFERIEDAVRAIEASPEPHSSTLRLAFFDDSGGAIARAEPWVTVRPL